MGLLVRTAGADFSSIIFQQIIYGLVGCIGLYFFAFKVDYKILRRFAFPLLIFGLVVASLVFLPKVGFSHGGASRWISVGPFFFQPSEFFETGAYRLYRGLDFFQKRNIADFKTGFLPFAGILAVAGFLFGFAERCGHIGSDNNKLCSSVFSRRRENKAFASRLGHHRNRPCLFGLF